jgi:hypothetical protein
LYWSGAISSCCHLDCFVPVEDGARVEAQQTSAVEAEDDTASILARTLNQDTTTSRDGQDDKRESVCLTLFPGKTQLLTEDSLFIRLHRPPKILTSLLNIFYFESLRRLWYKIYCLPVSRVTHSNPAFVLAPPSSSSSLLRAVHNDHPFFDSSPWVNTSK